MPKPNKAKPFRGFLTEPRDLISHKGVRIREKVRGLTGTVIVGDNSGLIRYVGARTGNVVATFGEQNPLYRIKKLEWVIPPPSAEPITADMDENSRSAALQSSFLSVLSNGDIRLYNTLNGRFDTVVHRENQLLDAWVSASPMEDSRLLWSVSACGNVRCWALDIDARIDEQLSDDSDSYSDCLLHESSNLADSLKKPRTKKGVIQEIRHSLTENFSMKITDLSKGKSAAIGRASHRPLAVAIDKRPTKTGGRRKTGHLATHKLPTTQRLVYCKQTGNRVLVHIPSELRPKMETKRSKRLSDHWIDDQMKRSSVAHLLPASRRGDVVSDFNFNDVLEQRRVQREYDRMVKAKKQASTDLRCKTKKRSDGAVVLEFADSRKHISAKLRRRRDGKPFKRKYERCKSGEVWVKPNRVGIEGLTHFKGQILCAKAHPTLMASEPYAAGGYGVGGLSLNRKMGSPCALLAIGGFDRDLEVWDMCKQVRVFKGIPFVDHLDIAHSTTVTNVDWCKSHPRMVVSATGSAQLRTHDLRDGSRSGKRGVLRQRISEDYAISRMVVKSKQKVLVGDCNGNVFEFDYLRPVRERGFVYRRYRNGVAFGAVTDFAKHPTRNLLATVGAGRYLSIHRFNMSQQPLQRVYLKTQLTSALYCSMFDSVFEKKSNPTTEESSTVAEVSDEETAAFLSDDEEEAVDVYDDGFVGRSEGEEEEEVGRAEDGRIEKRKEEKAYDWGAADELEVNTLLDGCDSDELKQMLRRMESEEAADHRSAAGPPSKRRRTHS